MFNKWTQETGDVYNFANVGCFTVLVRWMFCSFLLAQQNTFFCAPHCHLANSLVFNAIMCWNVCCFKMMTTDYRLLTKKTWNWVLLSWVSLRPQINKILPESLLQFQVNLLQIRKPSEMNGCLCNSPLILLKV